MKRREIPPDLLVHERDALLILTQPNTRSARLRLRCRIKALLLSGRRYYVHSDVIELCREDSTP